MMRLDVLKGILIVLVIIDHNEFSRSIFPAFLAGLSFHVVGFMTIPFTRPAMPLQAPAFGEYLFRLYYPFALVTLATATVVVATTEATAGQHLVDTLVALYSGNSTALKHATHMGLLWFLPSFIALLIMRSAFDWMSTSARWTALALIVAAHPFLGLVPERVWNYLPLGVLPALYIYPLAYSGAWLHRRLFAQGRAVPMLAFAGLVFAVVKAVQIKYGMRSEVGFMEVADYSTPFALIINDLEAVTGTILMFQIARVLSSKILSQSGKYSMQLYLVHAFVALAVYRTVLHFSTVSGYLLNFLLSMTLTLAISLGISWVLVTDPRLRRMVFPKSRAELISGSSDTAKSIAT